MIDVHAQVQIDTGDVLAVGYFPTPPDDPNIMVVELTPEHREKLQEVGTKVFNADGTMRVIKPVPVPRVEQPDYGVDADPDNTTVIQVVTGLRQFIALGDPTPKQMATVLRFMARGLLFLLKRSVRLT